MGWWLSRATDIAPAPSPRPAAGADGSDAFKDATQRLVVLSRLQDLLAWGRKNSIWPFHFGLSVADQACSPILSLD